MISRLQTRQLVETSRVVFRLCALPNGAIVAARPDLPEYPANVQSYGFVWIRDAAFICAAAHRIGIHDIQEPFFRWLWERAENFSTSGRLINVYFPNGVAAGVIMSKQTPRQRVAGDVVYTTELQWDGVGALLWSIEDHVQQIGKLSRTAKLVTEAASKSLAKAWAGRHFAADNWDIWEERMTGPARGDVHTYTVAMSIRGLEAAEKLLGTNRLRQNVIRSMRVTLDRAYNAKQKSFARTFSRTVYNEQPDMSLLGLVFPAQQVAANDPRFVTTLQKLLKTCAAPNGGYFRYPGDLYSGQIHRGRIARNGAGAWPWLSAWAAIILADQGNTKAALHEFGWLLKRSRGHALPEQFRNDGGPSVSGLAVSHAFAVLAAERLKLLRAK